MTRGVEIIGGGLAGLGLGIALRRHDVPVTVHEAGNYPRHRVCGEFITSLDRETRQALQIEDLLATARRATGVSWCEDGRPAIRHRLPEPALCLSRFALDEALMARFIGLGGVMRTGSRAELVPQEGRVFACGRHAEPSSPWVGIKQHFRKLELRDELEIHFGHGGYIGLTAIDEETVNVCGLMRRGSADFKASMPDLARAGGFEDLSRRLARAEPVADSFCAVAGLDYRARRKDDGSFRIGDRAAIVPPFTGHGMTIALQSAVVAAPVLLRWCRGETDWHSTKREASAAHQKRFGPRLRAARLLHPLLLGTSTRRWAGKLHRIGLLPVGALYRMLH